jgi:RNA polymerase sigma-70 factor (ECF subfamily)
MDSTSISLLHRLREPDQESAWQRFVDLYAPLIFHWSRGQGLNATDASDLVQDVMPVLVTKLRKFEYDPLKNRFRGWLRTITVNKARDYGRQQAIRPTTGQDETIQRKLAATPLDLFEETEYRSFLACRALELMRAEFQDATWQACWKQVVEEQKATDVAQELGMTMNAAYLAKSRVLGRLREELSELIE